MPAQGLLLPKTFQHCSWLPCLADRTLTFGHRRLLLLLLLQLDLPPALHFPRLPIIPIVVMLQQCMCDVSCSKSVILILNYMPSPILIVDAAVPVVVLQ